eukprot:3380482-Pyramimonas_sp.AAC.1
MRSGASRVAPWVAGALRLPQSSYSILPLVPSSSLEATRTTGVRAQPRSTLHGRTRAGSVAHTLQIWDIFFCSPSSSVSFSRNCSRGLQCAHRLPMSAYARFSL